MRRLLVINTNTSTATSQRIAQCIAPALPADVAAETLTARFGAPYIACEASYAVAGHALLDTWAHAIHGRSADQLPHAVLIGCFGDPGLFALREASACPITGLAEAAFIEAAALGPFAVVTGGARWRPMLTRLAQSLGFDAAMRHIETVSETGAQLQADSALAMRVLTHACQRAADSGVRSVILGGAGLAGYATQIQSALSVPLIDGVLAGARVAMTIMDNTASVTPSAVSSAMTPTRNASGFDVSWRNLSGPMTKLGSAAN